MNSFAQETRTKNNLGDEPSVKRKSQLSMSTDVFSDYYSSLKYNYHIAKDSNLDQSRQNNTQSSQKINKARAKEVKLPLNNLEQGKETARPFIAKECSKKANDSIPSVKLFIGGVPPGMDNIELSMLYLWAVYGRSRI